VGTGLAVRSYNALAPIDPRTGTHDDVVDAMLGYICDYANRFHSALNCTDHYSAGTGPIFFSLKSKFWRTLGTDGEAWVAARIQQTRLTARQFWLLRYLFIRVQYTLTPPAKLGHIALCVASPEAKTIDFLCSAGVSAFSKSGCKPSTLAG
jgi:hypothetical protein